MLQGVEYLVEGPKTGTWADSHSGYTHCGWSMTVTGRLRLVRDGVRLTRAGVTLGRASLTLTSVRLAGDGVGLVSSNS